MKMIPSGKISAALLALCSSILTGIVSGTVVTPVYTMIQMDDGSHRIEGLPTSAFEMGRKCGLTLGIFLLIWVFLTILIRVLFLLWKKYEVRRLPRFSRRDLRHAFVASRDDTLTLYKEWRALTSEEEQQMFAKMQLRTLADLTFELHDKFCHPSRQRQKEIHHCFRHEERSVVTSISSAISYYEFDGLLELLESLVIAFKDTAGTNDLLSQDCVELSKVIEDIRNRTADA